MDLPSFKLQNLTIMNHLSNSLVLLLLSACFQHLTAQELSFCNWSNDKKGAVVLTFDDWLEGHEKLVVPELLKRRLPATFFITAQNTKWRKESFPTMRMAFKNGSEIANHTLTHPDLTSIPFAMAKKEIAETRQLILDSIPGAKSLTFAYPMGTKNQAIIDYLKKEHIAARAVTFANEVNIKYNFATEQNDYYKIKTVRIWKAVPSRKVGDWLKYTEKGGGLLTFMIHSIYNDSIQPGWDGMPFKYFNGMLDSIQNHQPHLWVTTLEKAVQYHTEKRLTKIETLYSDTNEIQFVLHSPLSDEKYFQPLTLKIASKRKGVKKVLLNQETVDFTFKEGEIKLQINPLIKSQKIQFIY